MADPVQRSLPFPAADGHAALPLSSAGMWMSCHAWLHRQPQESGDDSTEASQWGTDAHHYLEDAFSMGIPPTALVTDDPDEQAKAVCAEVAYNYAVDWQVNNRPCALRAEERVYPTQIALAVHAELCFGRMDISLASNTKLEIADLKSGFRIVEPTSPQLKAYLLGELNAYWPDRSQPCPFKDFVTTVIQPRAQHKKGPIRSMHWELQDILQFEQELVTAVQGNIDGGQATPGKAQCKYCKAQKAGNCPEYIQWAGTAIIPASLGNATERSIQDLLSKGDLSKLPVEELAEVKNAIPTLQAFADSVNQEVRSRLDHGQTVPGWKLSQVEGRPKWLNKEPDLRKQFRTLGLKPAQFEKKTLCTPLQVMKAKKITAEQVDGVRQLWGRGDPTYKVVEDTHPAEDSTAWMQTIPNYDEVMK